MVRRDRRNHRLGLSLYLQVLEVLRHPSRLRHCILGTSQRGGFLGSLLSLLHQSSWYVEELDFVPSLLDDTIIR